MNTLIKYYQEHNIEAHGTDSLLLKRPIKKGRFELNHADIKIMKKVEKINSLLNNWLE